MEEINLKNLQLLQLDLLKKIKNICNDNHLTYYLFFGSLLGCVRHKGFIPWDDDIDIVMPRDDYEKLIDYCLEHDKELKPYGIVHYRNRKKYSIVIAKFENNDYEVIDINGKKCAYGVNIDIYPLDGVGNDMKDIIKATNKMNSLRKISDTVNNKKKKKDNILVSKIRKCMHFFAYLFIDYVVLYVDKRAKRKKIEDCKYIGIPCWQTDIGSYFDKNLLGECYGVFEGEEYPIPEGYDVILKQIYGDYMKLPDESQRKLRHVERVYKKD